MSSLRLFMLFFSERETPRIMFVILTQGPCSPVLVLTWRSSYADTVGEEVKKNWQELRPVYRRDSSPECSTRIPYVFHIPSYITARQYFLNPATHSSKLHTQKRRVISGAMLLKKKNMICALSVHAQASTQVSFMSSQATLHQGRVNLCIVQI